MTFHHEIRDHRKIINESMNHSWNEFLKESQGMGFGVWNENRGGYDLSPYLDREDDEGGTVRCQFCYVTENRDGTFRIVFSDDEGNRSTVPENFNDEETAYNHLGTICTLSRGPGGDDSEEGFDAMVPEYQEEGDRGWQTWGLGRDERKKIVNQHQAAADAKPGFDAGNDAHVDSDDPGYEYEQNGKTAVQVLHFSVYDVYKLYPPLVINNDGFETMYILFRTDEGELLSSNFVELELGGDPSNIDDYAGLDDENALLQKAFEHSSSPEQVLDKLGYWISDGSPSEAPTAQASTAQGSETVYDKFKKDELRKKEKMKGKKYGNPYGENEFGGYFPEE